MDTVKDAASRKFLATLGNILVQFQIEQNKKAEADSQAAKPEKSATAEPLADNPQAKRKSTTKKRHRKDVATRLEKATPTGVSSEQFDHPANPGVADTDT